MAEPYGPERTDRLGRVAGTARRFEYAVELDTEWGATSDRGGSVLAHEDGIWTPEHLLLAALCRCTLTSLRYHAERGGLTVVGRGGASGVVTKRESDGRYAFVTLDVDLCVAFDPLPTASDVAELLAKAERDCFVGASLTVAPRYHWTVNGDAVD
jgi:organic hydroperoxide reductase OsmC/OhrA